MGSKSFKLEGFFEEFKQGSTVRNELESFLGADVFFTNPPSAALKPLGLFYQKKKEGEFYLASYEDANNQTKYHRLADILDSPKGFNVKLEKGYLSKLRALDVSTGSVSGIDPKVGFKYLDDFLSEMGIEDGKAISSAIDVPGDLFFTFYYLRKRRYEADKGSKSLQSWLKSQKADLSHPLIKALQKGQRLCVATGIGNFSSVRMDYYDPKNKYVRFGSDGNRPTFALEFRDIRVNANGDIELQKGGKDDEKDMGT